MTGTAATSSEEFYKVYGLNTVAIPTNKPSCRTDHNDLIFQSETGKMNAIAKQVRELHLKGQPVLSARSPSRRTSFSRRISSRRASRTKY